MTKGVTQRARKKSKDLQDAEMDRDNFNEALSAAMTKNLKKVGSGSDKTADGTWKYTYYVTGLARSHGGLFVVLRKSPSHARKSKSYHGTYVFYLDQVANDAGTLNWRPGAWPGMNKAADKALQARQKILARR